MKLTSTHYTIFFIIIIVGGLVASQVWGKSTTSGILDEFAQCISDSNAKFYGAFWCPHCNDQKALFGSSVKLLPYVECSTSDGKGQVQECTDAGITGYPTWEFADGTREGGLISLEDLAEKTGCKLPEND